MEAHEVTDLLEARRRRGEAYLEFLRVASMSCGLYELPRGGEDKQSPHAEDEVYYVVRGRARIRVRGEDREVRPGSFVFVPGSDPAILSPHSNSRATRERRVRTRPRRAQVPRYPGESGG